MLLSATIRHRAAPHRCRGLCRSSSDGSTALPLLHGSDATLPPVKALLRRLYLSGQRVLGRATLGQPRVVVAVTGGGGQFFADLLREPGASSCLIEAIVPYDKSSCLSFLEAHGRRRHVDSIGFCSAEMAALLAEAARDRALELTPLLCQWPDALGVASTATVVSHYTRRGPYRVHAAGCGATGATSTYTHSLIKGARDRAGEDGACALLTARAMADAAGLEDAGLDLASYGVRLSEAARPEDEPVNAVGERPTGVEEVPASTSTRKCPHLIQNPCIVMARNMFKSEVRQCSHLDAHPPGGECMLTPNR